NLAMPRSPEGARPSDPAGRQASREFAQACRPTRHHREGASGVVGAVRGFAAGDREALPAALKSACWRGLRSIGIGRILIMTLEHDPEKWIPLFGKDHAPPKIYSG